MDVKLIQMLDYDIVDYLSIRTIAYCIRNYHGHDYLYHDDMFYIHLSFYYHYSVISDVMMIVQTQTISLLSFYRLVY